MIEHSVGLTGGPRDWTREANTEFAVQKRFNLYVILHAVAALCGIFTNS